jgi:hypothetical protein
MNRLKRACGNINYTQMVQEKVKIMDFCKTVEKPLSPLRKKVLDQLQDFTQ